MFRGVFFLILALMSTISWAKPAIDYQCEFCTTAHLDSLNIKISPVRVNQVGYKANDYHKRAFVADPHASANGVFQILNLQTGIIDHTGTLSPLGNFPELDGKIQINAYWNSITRLGPPFVGNTGDGKENLFEAKFGTFTKDGRYKMIVGPDTSKQFEIRDDVYNDVIETVLHFFGVQRSGDTDSWFHPPSHLLDGSALGAGREGSLAGGWYDCGDHFKVSQTTAYTLTNLMLTYTLWPEKSEDRYGSSYNDTLPYGNDGIPDVLREAKVGADFVYKLYKESKKDGLIASNDMYQQVGVHANDHAFWDRPEKQDAQPFSKGGPDRVVHAGTGVDVGAQYVAGLALFAKSWEPFDPDYAAELKAAAIDMYDNVVLANLGGGQLSAVYGFYPAQGRWDDDFAMGTIGMWYLTGDQKYGDLLYKDKSVGPHGTNAKFNMETFPGGALASQKELFSAGGWVYDYQNTHLHALWAAYKFFFATDAKAATWNVPAAEAKEMRDRIRANILTRMVNESSNGSDTYNSNTHLETHYPYNLLFTGNAWGFNRYNFGAVLTVAAAYDVLRVEDPVKAKDYYEVLMDNLNYTLGINPWELSFVIGAGTKYSNHPHHRGASPEGYNAGGIPYEYKKPIGAFMGGAEPGVNYLEDFNAYTSTETCSDYASQLLLATQLMAQDLPPDFEGPKRTNVVIDPVDQTTAYVNWEVNEMSQDTVHISKDAGGSIIQSVPVSEISKRHSVLIENLDASTTYYFTISGIDIFNNSSVEDNHGAWFSFTTAAKPLPPANPSDVRICNVTDESATLYWWTSEYASTSGVAYGTDPSNVTQTVTGDDKNSLTRFHQVTIKGLQPNTTYYADVISGGTKNDNNGSHYSFTTTVRFVDMSIYVKPKWDGSLLKYYFYVSNNDVKPFTGLELRYYYEAPDAATYSPKSWSTQYYDETGLVVGGTSTPTIGAAVNVPGTSYYYVPITLTDEISVSGAARIELEMKKNGWDDIHIDEFKDDWSVQAKDIPIEFKGIDFGNAGNFDSPDFVETIDSINIVTYAKTPYISAHYQGVHIYGYPPNYTSNTPNSHRDVNLFFESPLISPATSVEIDSFNIDFRGSAWATPDGNLDLVQLDGQKISQSAINSRVDSVSFSKSISGLKLGAKYYDFVAWHNSDQANCACEHQRITVDIDTVLVPVETRYIHTSPIDTLTGYINRRIPVTFYLSDEPNGTPIDEKINLVLAAKNPGIEFYATSSSDSPITEITLLNGQVTVYIMGTSINKNELIVRGKGGPEGFLYVPAENPIQILELPPYPIIDRAIILDDDCNGTPDHMTIQINQKYAAGQSLSGVSFTLQGDSVFVPAAQIKVTNDTVLTFSLEGDYKVDGAPAGDAILINKVDGKTVEFPLPYEDGIGPTAISSAVYENLNPGVDPDSVLVQFSESIRAPGLQFPFTIKDADGTEKTTDFNVIANELIDAERNIWMFALEPNAETALVKPDDIVQLEPSAPIFDLVDNQSGTCGHADLKVIIKYRPVPMKKASIFDQDANGQADLVKVEFIRKLRPIDLMDSVNVLWGPQNNDSVFTSSWTSSDSINWLVNLDGLMSKRVTMGAKDKGHGMLWQYKGDGAAFEKTSILLYDSVAPVVSFGRHTKGDIWDSLIVNISEPVDTIETNSPHFVRQRGDDEPILPSIAQRTSLQQWSYAITTSDQGYSKPGDSIRINPNNLSLIDQNQNIASIDNPYAPVVGSINKPTLEIKITPQHSVFKQSDFVDPTYEASEYISNDVVFLAQDYITGEWYTIGKDGTETPKGKSPEVSGMIFEIDISNLPIIGGINNQGESRPGLRTDPDFAGEAIYDIEFKIRFNVFDQLGQYVRKLTSNITLTNPNFIDQGGNGKFLMQWTAPKGKGLTDESSRLVATGVLIQQILFESKVFLHEDYGNFEGGTTTRSSSEKVKNVGYIRSK